MATRPEDYQGGISDVTGHRPDAEVWASTHDAMRQQGNALAVTRISASNTERHRSPASETGSISPIELPTAGAVREIAHFYQEMLQDGINTRNGNVTTLNGTAHLVVSDAQIKGANLLEYVLDVLGQGELVDNIREQVIGPSGRRR